MVAMAVMPYALFCTGARSAEAFFADVKPRQQHSFTVSSAAEVETKPEGDWKSSQPVAKAVMSQEDILSILSGESLTLTHQSTSQDSKGSIF